MRIVAFLVGSFWIVCNGWTADYCSLVVKVLNRQGQETEAWVTVEERGGRRLREENVPGGVRFCDLGILPVTVTVGDTACNQVIVRNVPLGWQETRELQILYDDEPCLVDRPPSLICEFVLRFADTEGNWVKGVSVTLKGGPHERRVAGDGFGRAHLAVPIGEERLAVATAKGYQTAELPLACTRDNFFAERKVRLPRTD